MSGFFEQHRLRLRALTAELQSLEGKAGLRESVAAQVEFIDTSDLRRRYFGVQDPALRRALIAKYRQVMEEHRQRYPASIADTKARIAQAKKKAMTPLWGVPAAVGVFAIFLAYFFWGLPASVVAALACILLGRWYDAKRRLHFAEELRLAEEELQTEEQGWHEESQAPSAAMAFSQTEERTGEEDGP